MASHPTPMRSLTPVRRNSGLDAATAAAARYRSATVAVQQQILASAVQRPSGPVAILWDIENCPVPGEVNAEDVAGNIRIALRDHPHIGAVTMFSAYGDFNHFPKKVREGCQRTGVNLIDVPNGKKDAADKAILVDMFLFALDNPPPSTIFLITGDVDFAPALHKLGQRGYVVVLVIPDGVGVSSALRGAGRYVWDWPCLCRGEGLVAARSSSQGRSPTSIYPVDQDRNQGRVASHSLYSVEERAPVSQYQDGGFTDFHATQSFSDFHTDRDTRNNADADDDVFGEKILAWRRPYNVAVPGQPTYSNVHTTPIDYGHQQYGIPGQIQPQGPRMTPSVHSNINRNATSAPLSVRNQTIGSFSNRSAFPTPEAAPVVQPALQSVQQSDVVLLDAVEPVSPGGTSVSWVQPGDLTGLKKQLVRLLNQNAGKMTLVKVPAEYNKQFGRPLYLAEYNALKLVHLIEKMKDTLVVKGEGTSKTLHLVEKKSRVANKYKPSSNRTAIPKSDKDRDASEDSDPEGVVTVKEIKGTIKTDSDATEGLNQRHLLDMDMDDATHVQASLPPEWDSVIDLKGKFDVTKNETVIDVGEVDVKAEDYEEDVTTAYFKRELQELLVVYAYNIPLRKFVKLYQQRYARDLDLQYLGADSLESLFQKVKDVAVLKEKVVKGDPLIKELYVVTA